MGGYGSGRWGWYTPKRTVEQCYRFSIDDFARAGAIAPGRRAGGRFEMGGLTVEFETDCAETSGRFKMRYTAPDGERVAYWVDLVTVRPNFGGLRWYALCPNTRCRQRVSKLYKPTRGRFFACRDCHELTYKSRQEHDKTFDKWRRLTLAELGQMYQTGSIGLIPYLKASSEKEARLFDALGL